MPTATQTPPRLKGMVAVSKNSGVKPLGYIVWFSIPDEDIKVSRLRRQWVVKGGLDPRPLPPSQKSVNAFKRAVRAQEGTSTNEKDGTKTETDVREILENGELVEYQISRVTRDLGEHRIVYQAAIRVWFTKATEEIDMRPLGDVPTREAFAIMDAIKAAYDAASETVPGSKVRTIVRHVLKDEPDDNPVGLSGENLRGKAGGIYFVLARHQYDLERLSTVLWGLFPGPSGRAYLHMVPLADGASERELIRTHHAMNSIGEIDEAMFDLAKLLREDEGSKAAGTGRKRAVRDNVLKHHTDRVEKLGLRLTRYADALDGEVSDVQKRFGALQKQMAKVQRLG
jgi:hypothetical protein